jgi:[protein-PII] uridylyltransferase
VPADQIRNRDDILDRADLATGIDRAIAGLEPASIEARAKVLEVLRAALSDGGAEIRRRFDAGESTLLTLRARTYLIDKLVLALYDFARAKVFPPVNPSDTMAIVGVGGYGRRELAPYSDIDLLFLKPPKATPWVEQVVEYMLYLLWDLGLKLGHATRSVAECLKLGASDLSIRTALLESRLVGGEDTLYADLKARFQKEIVAKTGPAFVEAKLAERDERHKRFGDSRYVVEPNVKEGKGGLRDLHTLFWIAKYLYRTDSIADLVDKGVLTGAEYRRFANAQSFLWRVRCHLHYLAERPEERLTFDVQHDVATRMGYTGGGPRRDIERFMYRYYLVAKDVGDLTRIFCAALEDQHKKRRPFVLFRLPRRRRSIEGFEIEGGRLTLGQGMDLRRDPAKILRLFHLAQERGLDIHPNALRLVRQNLRLVGAGLRKDAEANRLFLDMLTSRKDPESALRRLNEAGVFGRFVPDFGRVVARMQHDMYHRYTVDEHTIRAIGILAQIEKGELAQEAPLASAIVRQIPSRQALYLAVLLHDVAKGRGGDHSVLGEGVARKLGRRLGLSPAETETAAWLVRWHLAMAMTAFKRDLSDPKTIDDFVALVQSLERLRLLLVLTVADIRAVGPEVWNGWKGQLLRDLYAMTEEVLSGGQALIARADRVAAAQQAALALLEDFSPVERAAFAGRHFDSYWLSHDASTLARHARLIREADQSKVPLTIRYRPDAFRANTEMIVYVADHPGLFARLTGAIAASGGNIVSAKISTTRDGMALDTFYVQDALGGAFDRPDRLAKLSSAVERTLAGEMLPRFEIAPERLGIPSRAKAISVEPAVLIDNTASRAFTVIEVQGRDRPGLLYDVTRALFELSLSISSARVATYGVRAVDVFYVADLTGAKVTNEARLKKIEQRLLLALGPPEERARFKPAEREPKRPRKLRRAGLSAKRVAAE